LSNAVSPISCIEGLAQLLSDAELRQQYAKDPELVAGQLGICAGERHLFIALPVEQLAIQAELLLKKRMREAWKIIPLSFNGLGEAAATHFYAYAGRYWPDTWRRHVQDAWHFCRYLQDEGLPWNRSEWNRLDFVYQRRYCRLGIVSDVMVAGKNTTALQLLYRKDGRMQQRIFYLGTGW